MTLDEFMTRVIDEGIQGARVSYAKKPAWLKGSVAGFEACRGKRPVELKVLLDEAHKATHDAFADVGRSHGSDDYWEVRHYELQVEWVCNCVSAVLMNQGLPVIVPPTARGVMRAAEVLEGCRLDA